MSWFKISKLAGDGTVLYDSREEEKTEQFLQYLEEISPDIGKKMREMKARSLKKEEKKDEKNE